MKRLKVRGVRHGRQAARRARPSAAMLLRAAVPEKSGAAAFWSPLLWERWAVSKRCMAVAYARCLRVCVSACVAGDVRGEECAEGQFSDLRHWWCHGALCGAGPWPRHATSCSAESRAAPMHSRSLSRCLSAHERAWVARRSHGTRPRCVRVGEAGPRRDPEDLREGAEQPGHADLVRSPSARPGALCMVVSTVLSHTSHCASPASACGAMTATGCSTRRTFCRSWTRTATSLPATRRPSRRMPCPANAQQQTLKTM